MRDNEQQNILREAHQTSTRVAHTFQGSSLPPGSTSSLARLLLFLGRNESVPGGGGGFSRTVGPVLVAGCPGYSFCGALKGHLWMQANDDASGECSRSVDLPLDDLPAELLRVDRPASAGECLQQQPQQRHHLQQ